MFLSNEKLIMQAEDLPTKSITSLPVRVNVLKNHEFICHN